MLACTRCGKSRNISAFSRHKKGSSGAGGVWALRAPIHKRTQRPNLHIFKGQKYCTKCLRIIKKTLPFSREATPERKAEPQSAQDVPASI